MFDRLVLLDAAMGTALQGRGLPTDSLPEEWLIERPQEIVAVHTAHAAAGAQVLLTCSFNCTAPRLSSHGLAPQLERFCATAHQLARCAGQRSLVAGDLGPTGLVLPDQGGTAISELREQFSQPFRAMQKAGVDLLWTETHYSLAEARAALAAGRSTGLPVVVTMVFAESNGRLFSLEGAAAAECLRALAMEGATAVGVNCTPPSAALMALASTVSPQLSVPLVIKPNAGTPGALLGPAQFAELTSQSWHNGARLVGGCCGATAEHLRALHVLLGVS